DSFDLELDVFSQVQNPQAQTLTSLLCPSDGGEGFFVHTSGKVFGKGNYAAYVSPVHVEHQTEFPGALGGFDVEEGKATGQKMRRVKDGTTKTICFAEVRRRPGEIGERDPRGAWAVPWAGSSLLSVDLHSVCECGGGDRRCERARNYGLGVPYIPKQVGTGGGCTTQQPADVQTPNKQTPINDQIRPCAQPLDAAVVGMPCTRRSGNWSSASSRSQHLGGVNACALDGHVGFIGDDVDPRVLAMLVSISDGLTFDITDALK
ncbi:MAG: DUF1559 domain-containing protein, partial [Planctomycetota bacterium]